MTRQALDPKASGTACLWLCCFTLWSVQLKAAEAADPLQEVRITAEKQAPDEEVKRQVETALHDDPYFYDEHVTVTVTNGVVHLEGMVFDASDIPAAVRIIRKKVGDAKRVVEKLEICTCDGGA